MDNCPFCTILTRGDKREIHLETQYFFVISSLFPALDGHLLIISKRHIPDIFGLNTDEACNLPVALRKAKKFLDQKMNPDGYNVIAHCGEHGGQTVFHLHVHLLPRFQGDVRDSRGGVIEALRKQLKSPLPNPNKP